jgi:hypothetical protein
MKRFDYIQDAGHGWVKVPVSLLIELDIADKVSHYSYYRAGFGYLEEDCDLCLFFNAFHARYGHDPVLRDRISDRSRVRNYDQYNKAHHKVGQALEKALLKIPAAAALHAAGRLEIIIT